MRKSKGAFQPTIKIQILIARAFGQANCFLRRTAEQSQLSELPPSFFKNQYRPIHLQNGIESTLNHLSIRRHSLKSYHSTYVFIQTDMGMIQIFKGTVTRSIQEGQVQLR